MSTLHQQKGLSSEQNKRNFERKLKQSRSEFPHFSWLISNKRKVQSKQRDHINVTKVTSSNLRKNRRGGWMQIDHRRSRSGSWTSGWDRRASQSWWRLRFPTADCRRQNQTGLSAWCMCFCSRCRTVVRFLWSAHKSRADKGTGLSHSWFKFWSNSRSSSRECGRLWYWPLCPSIAQCTPMFCCHPSRMHRSPCSK